jgi:hypothetical protein
MKYPLTVNYKQQIEKLVTNGKYDYANSNIVSANFPEEKNPTAELEAVLFHPDEEDVTSEAVLERMENENLRPASVRELLVFGVQFPDVQRQFPIVALGTVVQLYGDRLVACLGRGASGRSLALSWFDGGWYRRCRFLAFRKHDAQPSDAEFSQTLVPLILEIAGQRYELQAKKLS